MTHTKPADRREAALSPKERTLAFRAAGRIYPPPGPYDQINALIELIDSRIAAALAEDAEPKPAPSEGAELKHELPEPRIDFRERTANEDAALLRAYAAYADAPSDGAKDADFDRALDDLDDTADSRTQKAILRALVDRRVAEATKFLNRLIMNLANQSFEASLASIAAASTPIAQSTVHGKQPRPKP
jgi:hypothetical protein